MEPVAHYEAAAEILRQLMAERRLSIRQLGEAVGVPYVTIYRRVNGQSPMNLRELYLFANVLGVKGSDILARAEGIAK